MSASVGNRVPKSGLGVLHAFPAVACARRGLRRGGDLVIRARTRQHERTRVLGPLSLFSNRIGSSRCVVDGRNFTLAPGAFALSTADALFSLSYDGPVEAFNVHFSDTLVGETLTALKHTDPLGEPGDPREVLPLLRRQSPTIAHHLRQLHAATGPRGSALDAEQAQLALLVAVLAENEVMHRAQGNLSALKQTTRRELLVRIHRAIDHMHVHYAQPISLAHLARVSCISRYHFLRSFRALTGQTPQRYLGDLRLDRARELLERSALPLQAIATQVGYSDASSLSRAFSRRYGTPPSGVRAGEAAVRA